MNATSVLPIAARRGPATPPVRPQLTSLVDMMTILLVFLLKSFSMEGNLMTPAAGLQLPTSTSRDQALPETSVEVTRSEIRVDGRSVVTIAASEADAGDDVPALAIALEGLAVGEDAAVTIQCDRDQEYHLLERVMATCSRAGFTDFSLLVTREEP